MQVVTPDAISGKKVLLRLDLDVPLTESRVESQESRMRVAEDFRLKAVLPTLTMCLQNAEQTIIMGHIGRPEGKVVEELSVEPIFDWLEENGFWEELESGKLKILENLRFESGESFDTAQDETAVSDYAKELAALGEVYINEAFAAHHASASITILPTLLPHFAGLRFAEEVERLTKLRNQPMHPLTAIIGGVKIEDKLPAVLALSKIADYVLVGGKIAAEIKPPIPHNVFVAKLNEEGTDVSAASMTAWTKMIFLAKTIIWNGPMGKIESGQLKMTDEASERKFLGSGRGTYEIAKLITESGAESIVGGGDTISALNDLMMLERFSFVSVGGGAMLEYLSNGTLPSIEALK